MEREAIKRKRGLLGVRIDTITTMAEAQRDRTEKYIAQQRVNVERMRAEQKRLGKTLQARHESFKRLREEGLSSEDQVLNAHQRVIDNEVQRADLELKLQEIELSRIESEDNYVQQLAFSARCATTCSTRSSPTTWASSAPMGAIAPTGSSPS